MNGHDAFFPIEKSFVPGQGYKSAKKLTDIERHIVRNKSLGNRAAFKTKGVPFKNAPASSGNKLYPKLNSSKRGALTRVVAHRKETGAPHGVQGFSQPDGRGGGRLVIHSDVKGKEFQETARHEMAHIAPKRNPHRFFQRVNSDPKRLGRDEGRADFVASGKQTTGQYPGDRAFKEGYNEVQGKMAAAQYRKNLRKR